MSAIYHYDIVQGSDDWMAARNGILTASEMKLIITAKNLLPASNEKERDHMYELAGQLVSGYTEMSYVSDDMELGKMNEIDARELYNYHYAPVKSCGFVTNDKWGFKIGYSPDGLVGDDGLIECKSRRHKFQMKTIVNNEVPEDYIIQIQTGLLVTERSWCDFVTYSAGLPMFTKRVEADPKIQEAIVTAASVFHVKMRDARAKYEAMLKSPEFRLIPTDRKEDGDMYV